MYTHLLKRNTDIKISYAEKRLFQHQRPGKQIITQPEIGSVNADI